MTLKDMLRLVTPPVFIHLAMRLRGNRPIGACGLSGDYHKMNSFRVPRQGPGLQGKVESAQVLFFNYRHWIILTCLLLLGSVRLYNLGMKSLWLDEAVIWQIAHVGPLSAIVESNAARNSAPPLYALLISPIASWTNSEAILRLLSCIAGIIAVPAMYYLLRCFLTEIAALAGASLLALSPTQVAYAQELREYSLTVLLTILILFFFLRFLFRPKAIYAVGLIVFSLIGLFTQYGIALLLVGLALTAVSAMGFWKEMRQRQLLLGLGAFLGSSLFAAIAVFFLALRYQIHIGGFAGGSYLAEGYWDGSFSSLGEMAISNTFNLLQFASHQSIVGLMLLFILWGVLTLCKWRTREGYLVLLMLVLPFSIVFIAALLRLYPYIGARQDIFLTVGLYALTAVGLEELFKARRVVFILTMGIIVIVFTYSSWRKLRAPSSEEMRPLIPSLCSQIKDSDIIFVDDRASPAFEFYRSSCSSLSASRVVFGEIPSAPSKGRVWFVLSHVSLEERDDFLQNAQSFYNTSLREFIHFDGAWLYFINSQAN